MRSGKQAGFSLIEILIAAVVFGLLTTGVVYFLTSQNRMGARNAESLQGLNLGKQMLDSIKVAEYARIQSGSDTVDQKFIRSWHLTTVVDGAGIPIGCKKIDIAVYWPLAAKHSLSMTSQLSDDKYKDKP